MGKRIQPELPWDRSSSEPFQLGEGPLRGEETGTFKTRLVTAIRNTLAGTCAGSLPPQRRSSVGESKPKTSRKCLLLLQPRDAASRALAHTVPFPYKHWDAAPDITPLASRS